MFEHVLVDEYQDVNALQVDIVQALRAENRGLTAVGDDFQAIYGFRSASADHILDFGSRFPDATAVTLERNYRSTQPILDVANAVAAEAERAHPKRLRSKRASGERPRLALCRDEAEEAVEVAERVLAEHERGIALRDQAVLMRAAHHSDALELELGRRRIPFVKYGGIRYLEAAHVKDLLALMRIVVNPADRISWFRVLQLLEGVGPRGAEGILEQLAPGDETRGRLAARWERLALEVPEQARADGSALVRSVDGAHDGRAPGQQAELLARALTPLIQRRYANAEARVRDLALLAEQAV